MKHNIAQSISFEMIFDNSAIVAMVVMNTEGLIIDVNNALQVSYGYTKEELLGQHFSVLFTPEDKLKLLPEVEIETVLQKGHTLDINYILHKNGSYLWTTGETVVTKDHDERKILVKMINSINKEKILENYVVSINKELLQTNEDLKRMNNDQDAFIYMASHDLKSPILNIESLVKIFLEELPSECLEQSAFVLSKINESIEKFKTVIHNLSLLGKQATLNSSIKTEVNFLNILEDIKAALHSEIEELKVKFTEDFLITSIETISIGNLRSIMYNLISNAIKYRDLDRRLEIKVSTEKKDKYTLIKVCDNGIGIKEQYWEKVFQMYHRIQEQSHIEGTGVGLSIVNKLVKNALGKIELKSKVGEGSTFKIYLPN